MAEQKNISPKQKRVVHEWIQNGFSATKAYREIYNCKDDIVAAVNASRMFKKECVQEYLGDLMQTLETIEIANTSEILMYLTKVMRGQEKDAFGLDPGLRDRNQAAELLGKANGIFTQKLDLNATAQVIIVEDIEIDDDETEE